MDYAFKIHETEGEPKSSELKSGGLLMAEQKTRKKVSKKNSEKIKLKTKKMTP